MSEDAPDEISLSIGQSVYDADGRELGTIRGFDEDGIFVTTREGIESMSVTHEHSVPEFGEAELMWRCSSCGAMGDLQSTEGGVPERCPDCGGPKEDIYYWIED